MAINKPFYHFLQTQINILVIVQHCWALQSSLGLSLVGCSCQWHPLTPGMPSHTARETHALIWLSSQTLMHYNANFMPSVLDWHQAWSMLISTNTTFILYTEKIFVKQILAIFWERMQFTKFMSTKIYAHNLQSLTCYLASRKKLYSHKFLCGKNFNDSQHFVSTTISHYQWWIHAGMGLEGICTPSACPHMASVALIPYILSTLTYLQICYESF